MNKQKLYWLCQIIGWSAIIVYEYFVYTLETGFEVAVFYLSILNIILSITLTHIYRLIIRRWNWVSLPLYRLIPRTVISGLVLGLIMTLVNLPYDLAYAQELITSSPAIFWSNLLSWSKSMFIWISSYTVYHYGENSRTVQIEKILLRSSMREAEAKVLRSQLNPHFTFNALNSIRALISEDPTRAIAGVTQLANILRNSLLADRRKTVELREEMKTVEDYLALEKIRYEERLSFTIDLDPKTLYLHLPPMMLQTLVENGIKHGVQKARQGGFITIVSVWKNERLHIIIRNTGTLGSKESGGLGLQNTEQRLELIYGSDAQFSIDQESEGVVRAEVTVPIQSEALFKNSQR